MASLLQAVAGTEIAAYDLAQLDADLKRIGTIARASAIVGGLSDPDKMPELAYNLPASACRIGGRLRHVPGSTCYGCYAGDDAAWQKQGGRLGMVNGKIKGSRYFTPTVKAAMARRLEALRDPLWVPAMVRLLRDRVRHFRWHDSGDLQSAAHLGNIMAVAEATPTTRHWLPTREKALVLAARAAYGPEPANLLIRASATRVDGALPVFPHVSGVVSHGGTVPAGAQLCPAPAQGNRCGDCRSCWDRAVPAVVYTLH